jgi:predicted acetyltransferase
LGEKEFNRRDYSKKHPWTVTVLEIRNITKNERRALMDLYRYAYNIRADTPIRDEELEEIIAEETLGVFESGQLVSSLCIHDFQQSLRSVLKDCGGIAGIATYPEARRKGYVRQLMQEAFRIMHEQGQSISMLDPFKQSFYEQFGYVSANAAYVVQAPLKHLQVQIKESQNTEWTHERLPATDAKDTLLEFIKDVGPSQYHGYTIYKSIPDGMWRLRVKDCFVVFIRHRRTIQAASLYRITGERIKNKVHTSLTCFTCLWRTLEARDRLFNFFAKHQDQIQEIIIHAPFDPSVDHWFKDVRLKIERRANWMVRLVDVKKAVDKLPADGEDIITVEISDSDCPWNNGVFSLQSEKGRLRLTSSSGRPAIRASIQALSSLVYGTQSLEENEFQGRISISEEWVRHTLQRWFPPLPLYNVLYF